MKNVKNGLTEASNKIIPRLNSSLMKILILCVTLLYSCTNSKTLFSSEPYVFPGIDSVVEQAGGVYLLSWTKVPTGDVGYEVYSSVATSNCTTFGHVQWHSINNAELFCL